MGLGNEFWRALSPGAARALRFALRAPWMPGAAKARCWEQAERRVSHYGVRGKARTRSGHLLDVDTSKMVEKQIYYFGEWEPFLSRHLLEGGPRQGTFLDIGANIGYFSLLASDVFDRVVAIEASPSIFERLARNVRANGLDGRVILHNVAVGERAGTLDFYFDPDQSGGSSLVPGGNRVFEARVPVSPLAAIVTAEDLFGAAFIKIDVEGLEGVVLDQILELRDQLRPDVAIMVEYDPARGIDDALSRCRQAGFEMRLLQGPYAIEEYLDRDARAPMTPLDGPPGVFSDLLLQRHT